MDFWYKIKLLNSLLKSETDCRVGIMKSADNSKTKVYKNDLNFSTQLAAVGVDLKKEIKI